MKMIRDKSIWLTAISSQFHSILSKVCFHWSHFEHFMCETHQVLSLRYWGNIHRCLLETDITVIVFQLLTACRSADVCRQINQLRTVSAPINAAKYSGSIREVFGEINTNFRLFLGCCHNWVQYKIYTINRTCACILPHTIALRSCKIPSAGYGKMINWNSNGLGLFLAR